MPSKKRKRSKKKGKAAFSHKIEAPTEPEITPIKAYASSSRAQLPNFPEDTSAIAEPNSLVNFLNSLSLKADEEQMKSWNSEELMNFGSTRIFQGLLAYFLAAHRMNDMRNDAAKHKNENTKLITSNLELRNQTKQALAENKRTQAKLEALEKEKLTLQEENTALYKKIVHMDESMKFIASRSHLKTKYDLFKECEQYGGQEWEKEKTYAAWERYAKSQEEDSSEEDAEDIDGEEEADGAEDKHEGASANVHEKELAAEEEGEEEIQDLSF